MSLYHFSVDQITRGQGHAVVNNAAYRAGERFFDEHYGEFWDYSRKRGVIYKEMFLPEHAPERFQNREVLWNEVEEIEKHPKAQLAHNIEFSLQNELSLEENIAVARKFIQETFVKKGMIVDMCVHDPPRNDPEEPSNPHVHILIPIRPLNEDGTWGMKQRRVYLKTKEGRDVFDENGKRKFDAVSTTDWSSKESLIHYREQYAFYFNEKFKEKGLTCRLDHHSYTDRGIPMIPQIHEGPAVGKMERRGISTEKRAFNRLIKSINTSLLKVSELLNRLRICREELHSTIADREKELGLVDFLRINLIQRDEVAATYQYGQEKAKLSNLKWYSEMVNQLEEREMYSLGDLQNALSKANDELQAVSKRISGQVDEIKKLENLIRLDGYYMDYRPLYLEMKKIRFKYRREKFKEAHKAELNKYFVAEKKLKENLQDGVIPVGTWKRELKQSYKLKKEDLAERDRLKKEIRSLEKMNDAVNEGMHFIQTWKSPEETETSFSVVENHQLEQQIEKKVEELALPIPLKPKKKRSHDMSL